MTVNISGAAHKALADKVREWSGWTDATLTFVAVPMGHASVLPETHQFTADPEVLVLNPNRVLRTVTPFRLRQEAVLTGALLHEAGHARYSRWLDAATEAGATDAAVSLARLLEEARIEGRMTREAEVNGLVPGAADLSWTMRAAAAHLIPRTTLSEDPDQALMDTIRSWALRAGRQYAVAVALGSTYTMPAWVGDFTALLQGAIVEHFADPERFTDHLLDLNMVPSQAANAAIAKLVRMAQGGSSFDSTDHMVGYAQEVLDILFPETEEPPMAGGGCGDEEQEPGEPEGEPQDGTAGDESDEQGEGGGESPSEADEAGEGEGDQPGQASQPGQTALDAIEQTAEEQTEGEAKSQQAAPPSPGGLKGGKGDGSQGKSDWRTPTAPEREVQHGAEKFLRNLIAPSETSKTVLTESPSASVDGGALAAWRAGGQVRDPRFFKRVRRDVAPSVPVKIAILVDVSSSMEQLQKPSALLSWALASAALDLRNFAGRGVQVESTLIHWGNDARVVGANGAVLPGIREVSCDEGTSAMLSALGLVEEQMPGFFDPGVRPENRLLVQFTDWELWGGLDKIGEVLSRGFAAGVNMLTVAPSGYSVRRSDLEKTMHLAAQAGRPMIGGSTLMRYNKMFPEQVWDVAAETLA